MDIKDLDKKQMVLLTLLITFVVSIATGIVTVSLMNQAPKAVPQTINNVIQRTIERVTTVEKKEVVDADEDITENRSDESNNVNQNPVSLTEGNILIKIYKGEELKDEDILGEGVLISESGIIMVDSSILNGDEKYTVVLATTNFDAKVIKKFNNGFSILKISEKVKNTEAVTDAEVIEIDTEKETVDTLIN